MEQNVQTTVRVGCGMTLMAATGRAWRAGISVTGLGRA